VHAVLPVFMFFGVDGAMLVGAFRQRKIVYFVGIVRE